MNRLKSLSFLIKILLVELICRIALIIATGYVLTKQNVATERLYRAINLNHTFFHLADQLRQTSDDLTRIVRTYAATGDSRFKKYFYAILDIRDGSVNYEEHLIIFDKLRRQR